MRLLSSPDSARQLGDLPIRQVNGAMVYVNDVAQVREGGGVQTNIVRENGRRGTYLSILKNGKASTLAIVDQVKSMLPQIKATLPDDVQLELLADQSVYVRATIDGVIREGVHRGVSHGADDPALPRELALDDHRGDLDPAERADVDHRAVGDRARRST